MQTTVRFKVTQYELMTDTFTVELPDVDERTYEIPATLMPLMTREYDEPEAIVDREFEIELP